MSNSTMQKRENDIYKQYQDVIAPFITELEVRDTQYPIEIFNEIRAIFTHLTRYKLNDAESELFSAERHVKRAILDCFKYMCVSMAEEVTNFRHDYRKVDLKLADNGKFLPELNRRENLARASYIKAKQTEIRHSEHDDVLYSLFETAYNNYSDMINYLYDSNEAILFASSHSKQSNRVTIISTIVTVISIIVAIVAII